MAALENEGIDIVFRDKANDLVVPTEGVSETTSFRLRDLTPSHVRAFNPQDGVHHLNYFRQRATWDAILGWLQ